MDCRLPGVTPEEAPFTNPRHAHNKEMGKKTAPAVSNLRKFVGIKNT
jgi:hypothetical protein